MGAPSDNPSKWRAERRHAPRPAAGDTANDMRHGPEAPRGPRAGSVPETPLVDGLGDADHLVRALSHDMRANQMLLEHSFGRLRRTIPPSDSAEVADCMAHVRACLDQSKRLLDDLVMLANTGSVDMQPARVESADVVREVLFEQRELLQRRNIDVQVDEQLPVVSCNRDRLKQVVTNLVRNAALHGCDREQPRLTISGDRTETGTVESPTDTRTADAPFSRFARLRIADNGPGVPLEQREAIFMPGRRLATAAAEGSGMGLAIVHKIVAHYGGTVAVTDTPDGGAAFEVQLPAAPAGATGGSRVDRPGETARPSPTPKSTLAHRRHRR